MSVEIERKFLVKNKDWKKTSIGVPYTQGYLSTNKSRTVRVRTVGDKGFLTIKGITTGFSRPEFEYEIPLADAMILITDLCEQPVISKHRYKIAAGENLVWEVDEFHGENEGLIVAEIELIEEHQTFERPDWLGKEVTGDKKYYNSSLVQHPFSYWKKE